MHEMRRPLATIWLLARSIRDNGGLDETQRHDIEAVIEEVTSAEAMLQTSLAFIKPATAKKTAVDIVGILWGVRRKILPQAKEAGVTIQLWRAEQAPLLVLGARRALRQAILNVADNAVQAMSQTGGTLTLACRATHGQVVVIVKDTGPGMEAESLAKIFEPFFSTKKGGIGLGLSLAKKIVRHHRGRINVKSRPGQGTTFAIWLPRYGSGRKQ